MLISTILLVCSSCEPGDPTSTPEVGELLIEFPVLPFRLDSGTNTGSFEVNYTLGHDALERLLAQKGYRTDQLRAFHFIKADMELEEPLNGGMQDLSLYVTPPVNGASRLAHLDSVTAEARRLELVVNRIEVQEALLRRSMDIQLSGRIQAPLTRHLKGTMALAGTAVVEH